MLVNDQSHECHVTGGPSRDQLVPPLHEDEDCESPKPSAKRVTNGFKVPMNQNGTSPTVAKGMDYILPGYMYMEIHVHCTLATCTCMLEVGRRDQTRYVYMYMKKNIWWGQTSFIHVYK